MVRNQKVKKKKTTLKKSVGEKEVLTDHKRFSLFY